MGLINFNNEQKLIQNEIRKFTLQEIEPFAQDIDKNEMVPKTVFKKLAELGYLCPTVPQELGGAELDTTSICIIIEELSKGCASIGFAVAVNVLSGYILKKSRRGRYDEYLKKLANGSLAGFDIGEAKKSKIQILQDNPLEITGTKSFILNGGSAEFFLIRLESEKKKGIYLVDINSNRLKTSKIYLLGLRSAAIVDISFDDLKIPVDFCLIDGAGYDTVIAEANYYFNLCLAPVSLGIAQAALESSIKYAKERRQFNRPICEFPMVREMIAEMKIKIEAARNFVYNAANMVDTGEDYKLASDIAALVSADAAVYCGIKAVQIFGGYGYTKDYPVERYLRDAKSVQSLGKFQAKLRDEIAQELFG
ncbi:MAG: acyl-CoA dehydrogenase family protein [bacterium]